MRNPMPIAPSLDWNCLNRFLLIGHEQGSYAVPMPDLRHGPTPVLDRCLQEDGVRVVRLAANLLVSGRPYRPEPALYALAKAVTQGDARTRAEALELLPVAARTGAHLFQLVAFLEAPPPWSRELRKAIGGWYIQRTAAELVNLVLRSPKDTVWDHQTILGLAYPKPPTKGHVEVFRWIAQNKLSGQVINDPGFEMLSAYDIMQTTNSEVIVSALLRRWPQLREDVPDQWLSYLSVWQQILPTLSSDALVRWLPRLAAAGLLHADSRVTASVLQRLQLGALGKTALAPVSALKALGAVRDCCARNAQRCPEALEATLLELFYNRVRATVPADKTLVIAIDPAATCAPDALGELPGISPREAFAAMTLMAAAAANEVHVLAFGPTLTPIAVGPDERIETLIAKLEALSPGPIDGASPIAWAVRNGVEADGFILLSDRGPEFEEEAPEAAFGQYQSLVGKPASWFAVSTGSQPFCPTPPEDLNMMEALGFDASLPALILELLGEVA